MENNINDFAVVLQTKECAMKKTAVLCGYHQLQEDQL
jgi:hypothetical protein